MKLGLSLKEECEARMKRDQEREKKRREHMRRRRSSSSSSSSSRSSSSSSRSSRGRRHRRRSHRSHSKHSKSRHRSRHRSADRGSFNTTNSKDPKLVASRLFLGNLPVVDSIPKEDVAARFEKYGKILAITLLPGYGFVQFENPEAANEAVKNEHNAQLKGHTIDVRLASIGKRGERGDRPERGEWSERGEMGESSRHSRRRSRSRSSNPDDHTSRSHRSHPPVPQMDPYARVPMPPPHMDPYMRGPPPPHMDPYLRGPPPFIRGPPPPHMDPYGMSRPRYPHHPLPLDMYGRPPFRDPYMDYPPVPVPFIPPPVVLPPVPLPPSIDCEIIVVDEKQRSYADTVKRRLMSGGIVTEMNILRPGMDTLSMVETATRRGVLFAIIVNEQNELHKSITVNILHGAAQEHRNMPLEDACAMVIRSFDKYVLDRKERANALTEPKMDFVPPNANELYLLNLLADNRFLTIAELTTMVDYLENRRNRLIETQGGVTKKAKVEVAPPSPPPSRAKQDVQSQILEMFRNDKDMTRKLAPPEKQLLSSMPNATPMTASSNFSSSINFDNPTVQKALDNLIMSGPSLLKNITENAKRMAPSGDAGGLPFLDSERRGPFAEGGHPEHGSHSGNTTSHYSLHSRSADGWPSDYKPTYGGNQY